MLSGEPESYQGTFTGVGAEGGMWIKGRTPGQDNFYIGGVVPIQRLDTPATTDNIVYDVVARCVDPATTSIYWYTGTMIMQEIGA